MAESSNDVIFIRSSSEEDTKELEKSKDQLECPICLQTLLHPAKLPCGHIFCFLCVKGVAYKNRKCAMCRREIPTEYLDNPQLVHGVDDIKKSLNSDGYQWFYEGRNGWWQYDERTSSEIEEAFQRQEKSCGILVAGLLYVVNFDEMVQLRKNEPIRQRKVKRDLSTIAKKGVKGICGLRIEKNTVTTTDTTTDLDTSIIVSDDAIIIASNIIDSTLAHADDEQEQTTNNLFSSQQQEAQQIMSSIILNNNSNTHTHNSNNNESNFDNNVCLFSQTLDEFRRLTLTNIIDSSDDSEDDDDNNPHIIL